MGHLAPLLYSLHKVKVSELEEDEDDGNFIKGEEDKVRRNSIMQITCFV